MDAAGRLVAAWDELKNGTRRVAFGRAMDGGAAGPGFIRELLSGTGPAFSPAVASADDSVIVAWTSGTPGDSAIQMVRLDRR